MSQINESYATFGAGVLLDTTDTYVPTTGFNRKGYDEILNDIVTRAQVMFGGTIDLTPTSPLYLLLETLAKELSGLWEVTEDLYYSTYIDTAIGNELDKIGASLGLPRYRPSHSYGQVEFTRLRDKVSGLFYRVDRSTGFVKPVPEYIYYHHPVRENPPAVGASEEELTKYEQALAYHDYFKYALPKVVIPEDITLAIEGDENTTYSVDESVIIPDSSTGAENPFTSSVNIECNQWGPSGNLSAYYQKSTYFNGAISRILEDPLNPFISTISYVFQEGTGLDTLEVGTTACVLTVTRSELDAGEGIICNCWHWYDKVRDLKPNGKYNTTQMVGGFISEIDLREHLRQRGKADPDAGGRIRPDSAIELVQLLYRDFLKENDDRYKNGEDAEGNPYNIENVMICWREPDNYSTFNMNFRNCSIDDSSTWYIADPKNERAGLFLYFRPVYDRTNTARIDGCLDYLVFRPLLNYALTPNETSISFTTVYAGFSETCEELYKYDDAPDPRFRSDATKYIKGYIGLNHRANEGGGTGIETARKLLPARGDATMNSLYCKPRLSIVNAIKMNLGYALQKNDIIGGRDYEDDTAYRERLKSTRYDVTATNRAITKYVKSIDGVTSSVVYDSILDPDDNNSTGFKVRVKTEDSENIFTDNSMNTARGQVVNDLIKLIKPAGVRYEFDNGIGYGVRVDLEVVGANYPDGVITTNIRKLLREYIRSLTACKPLDYGYMVDIITNCVDGVVKINRLQVFSGDIIKDPAQVDTSPKVSGRKYLSDPFLVRTFGEQYYVPDQGYSFFDESEPADGETDLHTRITVVGDKMVQYGCRRSDNCS